MQNLFSKKVIYFLFSIIIILNSLTAYTQKVALVLGGGGTKGLAHIGVLKALEENHIPIDYITGSSIGAIIGGMYASGYSPDSIEKIFLSEDVVKWARGEIDDKYIYYFKKPEQNASWVYIRFDYDNGWVYNLPTNIISPVLMDYAINELFAGAGAASGYNFDKLFVPFRCVASDISENKSLVFKNGDLGLAIRASMTVPFYFKPVKINGKLLFDGGMYNNFPADIAYQDFNPDFIVGSQVTQNSISPEENDVMSQIYTMLMNKTNYSIICDNSVIIKPDVPHTYNIISFDERKDYIDSGYTATIKAMKNIRQYVTRTISGDSMKYRRKEFNNNKPPLLIDSIFVSGLSKAQKKYVLKSLHHSPLIPYHSKPKEDLDDYKKNYFRLLADENIDYITPRLKYNKPKGLYDLYLDVTKQKHYTAEFGGLVSSNPVNEAFIGLQYNSFSSNAFSAYLNTYFGRFYNSFEGNARLDFPTRLPFYIKGSTSYSQWDYFNTTSYFASDKSPSYLFQYDTHSNLSFGFPVSNKSKLEAGTVIAHLTNNYYQTNDFTRLDTTDKNTFDMISVIALFDRNTLKKKQYSNQGSRFLSEFRYVLGNETNTPGSTSRDKQVHTDYHHWVQYHMSFENYFKTIGKLKMGFYSELHLSSQNNFTNYTSSILTAPAFQPTPDSKTRFNSNYRAYNFGGLGLKNIYAFTRSFDFRVEAYMFLPYKEILSDKNMNAYEGKPLQKRYFIGMAALVLQTPIGPLSFSLNYYDKSNLYENRFSVLFSFGYVIFNDKAL